MGENSSATLDAVRAKACSENPKARDRIVASARDLFLKHGIRGVGVEAIAEAAGTNKMTLYRHFGSKDDLVVECLQGAARDADAMWRDLDEAHPGDAMAQLHGWVRHGARCVASHDRGCALANAAIELSEDRHPARRLVEASKLAHRDRLVNLCERAGIVRADLLADTLSLLLEGARVDRQSVGLEGSCGRFVRIADAVIAAFAGS